MLLKVLLSAEKRVIRCVVQNCRGGGTGGLGSARYVGMRLGEHLPVLGGLLFLAQKCCGMLRKGELYLSVHHRGIVKISVVSTLEVTSL